MSELGNRLKEARAAKGLSLEELQEITKIQTRYLVGIEEGNYSLMPGSFYARAFIKQYAEAVDLSPEELFEEYKGEIPASLNDDIPEKLSRVTTKKAMEKGNSKFWDILPTIFISILVVGIIFLVWYFFFVKGSETDTTSNNNEKNSAVYEESDKLKEAEKEDKKEAVTEEDAAKENTQTEEEEKEETPKQEISVESKQGKNTVYEVKNAEQFKLKLVSTGETWVNIKNGKGYSFFQGMLKKGETDSKTVDLSKEEEAVLVIGNSTATEIYVNDEKIDYAVSPSKYVRQDITIRYIKEKE
ncbi:helix-turn-helix domain-containing protein [Niallia nealsonii]|uniref:Helix-turn-helix domain-containing protein n=1 Tax=Niallia nealsonii TaxID=115979 RepID=A0A2N0Z0R2_9BACI|nr:RodZ domain-containing protein [Niallia nealsonii]PKG23097.1 helix-turn-helix domain-containing protein [Niallia nealsonii]